MTPFTERVFAKFDLVHSRDFHNAAEVPGIRILVSTQIPRQLPRSLLRPIPTPGTKPHGPEAKERLI